MNKIGVYAYVDGSDLEDVFALIESEGHKLLISRDWSTPTRLISTHSCRTPDLGPGDLSDWDLGFNLEIPDDPAAHGAAYDDVRAIANFVADIHPRCKREFVFGIFNYETNVDEDFTFFGNDPTKIEEFLEILGHALRT